MWSACNPCHSKSGGRRIIRGQPGLHRQTLSHKTNKTKTNSEKFESIWKNEDIREERDVGDMDKAIEAHVHPGSKIKRPRTNLFSSVALTQPRAAVAMVAA